MTSAAPELRALTIADEPATWRRLGVAVGDDGRATVGGIVLELAGRAAGRGITGWSLSRVDAARELDGLPTRAAGDEPPDAGAHPNGAVAIDHVVVTTPDVERTFAALREAGLDLRRVREAEGAEGPLRQGFFRVGRALLEVAGPVAPTGAGPASFWGLVVVVADLDALAARLGGGLGTPRNAVQPGRRIATLRASAGASVAVAFMTPRGTSARAD
jgi:hypothetical protein